jgi:hypothetical protein
VLLPARRCGRPLCSPRVVGRVRERVAWMVIVSSDRQLGGGVTKGAPKPDGTAPPPSGGCLWNRRARHAPPPVAACGVTEPDVLAWPPLRSVPVESPTHGARRGRPPPVARASASTDVVTSKSSPARCVSRGSPPSSRVVAPA